MKLCECGCGEAAPIAKCSEKSRGRKKGMPMRFIHGHQMRGNFGDKNHSWKGGKIRDKDDRQLIYTPNHHKKKKCKYVYQSILIAEKVLGKPLPKGAMVHHATKIVKIDRDLVICENSAYHNLLHQRIRSYEACGNPSWRKCRFCKEYDALENLYINNGDGHHRKCMNKYQRERNAENQRRVSNGKRNNIHI